MSRLFATSYVGDAELSTKGNNKTKSNFVVNCTADIPLFCVEWNGTLLKKQLAFQVFDDCVLTDLRSLSADDGPVPFEIDFPLGPGAMQHIGPFDMTICLCGQRVNTVNWTSPQGAKSFNIQCNGKKCNFCINGGLALAHFKTIQSMLFRHYQKTNEAGMPLSDAEGNPIRGKDYFFMVPRMCSYSKNWMTCLHPPIEGQTYGTWKCYKHDPRGNSKPGHRCQEVKDLECFVSISEENKDQFFYPAMRDINVEKTTENAWWSLMMAYDSTFPFKPIKFETEVQGKTTMVTIPIAASKDGCVPWDVFSKHVITMLGQQSVGISRGEARAKRSKKD